MGLIKDWIGFNPRLTKLGRVLLFAAIMLLAFWLGKHYETSTDTAAPAAPVLSVE